MEQKIELLFVRRKAEIDLAAYEDPKFNDLLNRAEARGTFPMAELLQSQFSNLQSLVEVAIASRSWWRPTGGSSCWFSSDRCPSLRPRPATGGESGASTTPRPRHAAAYSISAWHFYDLRWLAELKLFQNVRHFHGLLARLLGEFNTQQRRMERRKLRLAGGRDRARRRLHRRRHRFAGGRRLGAAQ